MFIQQQNNAITAIISAHSRQLIQLSNKFRTCNVVEFSKMDTYVRLDGVTYNGVTRKQFEKVTKGIQRKIEPIYIDWKVKDPRADRSYSLLFIEDNEKLF